MPVEFPSSDLIEQYRQLMETETLAQLHSNGYSKTPRDREILLFGFREGFNRAKNYFLGLVKIY